MRKDRIFKLADSLKSRKDKKKKLEEDIKSINAEIEEIEKELSGLMLEAEVPNFSRAGSTFYLKNVVHASPLNGQKDALYSALKEHGYGDLVVETVNARTLDSFVKEQISLNQDAMPEWLSEVVSTYEKPSVGIRKA
ncbi:MAG: hypothetical protein IJV40_06455 [Oscillospiraceae bacterium]|nr:hypothetical protein [Oscillospiraceae bacterium]